MLIRRHPHPLDPDSPQLPLFKTRPRRHSHYGCIYQCRYFAADAVPIKTRWDSRWFSQPPNEDLVLMTSIPQLSRYGRHPSRVIWRYPSSESTSAPPVHPIHSTHISFSASRSPFSCFRARHGLPFRIVPFPLFPV